MVGGEEPGWKWGWKWGWEAARHAPFCQEQLVWRFACSHPAKTGQSTHLGCLASTCCPAGRCHGNQHAAVKAPCGGVELKGPRPAWSERVGVLGWGHALGGKRGNAYTAHTGLQPGSWSSLPRGRCPFSPVGPLVGAAHLYCTLGPRAVSNTTP